MTFKVTILGNSAAMPTVDNHHSAQILNVSEQFYLIDCGEGTQNRLMKLGINPLKINAIFISHLHGDHVYGIFPLIATMGMMGRRSKLKVFAPRPFDDIMEQHKRFFDLGTGFDVEYCEVRTRDHALIFENKVMEVYSLPLRHNIPCSGFLFKEKAPAINIRKDIVERLGLSIAQIVSLKRGEDIVTDDGDLIKSDIVTYLPYQPRSYAYCSDTQYSAKLAGLIQNVDLLFHESTFMNIDKSLAKRTGHSTSVQAAKIALSSGAKRLLLGHFSARYRDKSLLVDEAKAIFPNSFEAKEGATFEIKTNEK